MALYFQWGGSIHGGSESTSFLNITWSGNEELHIAGDFALYCKIFLDDRFGTRVNFV
jgi:hypothetical protein